MKILVGIDTASHYKSAINMSARMKFPAPHWTLSHSVDVRIPVSAYGSAAEAAYRAEFVQLANVSGETALEEAKEYTSSKFGDAPDSVLLAGGAAVALAQFADDTHTDLIAVHSDRKGRLGSFFLGSVSRGLAISAHQSILITKGLIGPEGPVSAVFATDHSDYANRALDKLIQMNPQGFSSIKVVSVLHLGSKMPIDQPDPMYAAVSVEEALWNEARSKTEGVATKLRAAGFESSSEIVDAHVNEALKKTMENTQADILIMGAQGHGVMHRMMLGSTCLHQVVAEPYSILIIRC